MLNPPIQVTINIKQIICLQYTDRSVISCDAFNHYLTQIFLPYVRSLYDETVKTLSSTEDVFEALRSSYQAGTNWNSRGNNSFVIHEVRRSYEYCDF